MAIRYVCCIIRLQGKTSIRPTFLRRYSSVDEYLPHVSVRVFVRGRVLARCFGESICPLTNTCPMCWRGYLSMGRIFAPCAGEGIRHGTNTRPMCWRGYSSSGRRLAHVLERVFVHGTNTCLTNRTRSQRIPIRVPIGIRIRAGCAILTLYY